MKKTLSRILCALLCVVTVFSFGCTGDGADTTIGSDTSPVTEVPVNTLDISEDLKIPEVSPIEDLAYADLDLNTVLHSGYKGESLHQKQFADVLDKIIIFNGLNADAQYAYVLGKKVETQLLVYRVDEVMYISLYDLSTIFGGEISVPNSDVTPPITTYKVMGKTVECTTGQNAEGNTIAYGTVCSDNDTSKKTDLKVYSNKKYITTIDDTRKMVHYISAEDVADIFGLTLYETDSGIIIYSYGELFDVNKGYYIAEEASKLFISNESEVESFTQNQFVDLPNVFKYSSTNVSTLSYPNLDIHSIVSGYAIQGLTAPVELAPSIVVGEGENADNYTTVRIFDRYQTLHTQFSAYPVSVKGGVQVAAANCNGIFTILTAPYKSADIKELRVFDANGSYKFSVKPSGDAPYSITSGQFNSNGDCFAVVSRNGGNKIEIFSAVTGELLSTINISIPEGGTVSLSTNHETSGIEGIVINRVEGEKTGAWELNGETLSKIDITDKVYNGVYSSAFGGYAGADEESGEYKAFSTISVYKDGATTTVDVASKENKFYSNWAKQEDDKYVTYGQFWHVRADESSVAVQRTSSKNLAPIHSTNFVKDWTTEVSGDIKKTYNTQYNMYEPCFTHRWNGVPAELALNEIKYEDTSPYAGIYKYTLIDRNNEKVPYKELSAEFSTGTYAPYIPELARIRVWSMRSYASELVTYYRQAPEYTVAVSPVHENEIHTAQNSTGDYNPMMVAGFCDYMIDLYGSIENINTIFGTSFKSEADFDAPRNLNRGNWDKYTDRRYTNPFFSMWVYYNRTIVSQRIVESYSEMLLAGFPPELIKAHSIPEGDAVAILFGSGSADERISPIDVVMNCGTGYGGTRYGVWYKNEGNFLSLAYNSGHRNSTLGEYSAMIKETEDPNEAYNQLKYMIKNGLTFTHVMQWEGVVGGSASMDAAERAAIALLQEENEPRAASSGGTKSIHEYVNGSTKFNIVQIGTKDDTPGLLKSVKEDGTFEGTVYLQPFHAKVVPVAIAENVTGSYTTATELSYDITGRVDAAGQDIGGINYNDTVDARIIAKKTGDGAKITVKIYHGEKDTELEVVAYTFDVTDETEYRYCFKNQVYFENAKIVVTAENCEISDMDITMLYEMSAKRYYNEMNAKSHTGGVSFDLLY